MQHKLPLHLWRDLCRSTECLKRLLAELAVQDYEGGVVGEVGFGFEVAVVWGWGGGGGGEEGKDWRLFQRVSQGVL